MKVAVAVGSTALGLICLSNIGCAPKESASPEKAVIRPADSNKPAKIETATLKAAGMH